MDNKQPTTVLPPNNEPPPPYTSDPANNNPDYPSPLPNTPSATYYPSAAPQPQYVPPPPYASTMYYTVQPGSGPSNVSTHTTVILTSAVNHMAPHPVNFHCPRCGVQVLTDTTSSAGALAWLLCVLIAFFGCWLGCCLLPFCVDALQDVEHRCPQCKTILGVYRRL